MSKPTGGDYLRAFQNSRTAFMDPFLQNAKPDTNALGLPRLVTGNFAVVCKMSSATKAWAVRGFLRDVPDLFFRYQAVNDYLEPMLGASSCLVGFRYVAEGVRVDGAWHPIVIMDWVEGVPLDKAVTDAINQQLDLTPLLNSWLRVDEELTGLGIAHGDLQHGNVIVNGSSIRLVDYDGMFVPTLAGRRANEEGHSNYRHPMRGAADYHRDLDRFSSLLIYTALRALSLRPQLWSKYGMPDDAMLFRKADLEQPRTSALFSELLALGDAKVSTLTQAILSALESNRTLGSLDQILGKAPVYDRPERIVQSEWLHDQPETGMHRPLTRQDDTPASQASPNWWRKLVSEPVVETAPETPEHRSWLDRFKAKWWKPTETPHLQSTSKTSNKPQDMMTGAADTSMVNPLPPSDRSLSSTKSNVSLPAWMQARTSSSTTSPVTPARTSGGPTQPTAPISPPRAAPVTHFIGSKTSYKYHLSSCTFAQRIPLSNRLAFATAKDAANAGYMACKVCRLEKSNVGQSALPWQNATLPPKQVANRLPPPTRRQISSSSVLRPVHPPAAPEHKSPSPFIKVGSHVDLELDGRHRRSYVLVLTPDPTQSSQLGTATPLGNALLAAREGDTITYTDHGRPRSAKVLRILE